MLKKNLNLEIQELKDLAGKSEAEWEGAKKELENKIKSLQEEVAERVKMLEFNIKQNS